MELQDCNSTVLLFKGKMLFSNFPQLYYGELKLHTLNIAVTAENVDSS